MKDRIYAVAATRKAESNGWTSAEQLPMFYLHSATQGITSEAHASRIASEIVGQPVTAYDVTEWFPLNQEEAASGSATA